jgi:DNA-binding NarL/FixJ family response regulator
VQTLRVLLVDPHEVVRTGLRTVLQRLRGVEVVGEAANTVSAVRAVADLRPDIIIADLTLPGTGIGLIEKVRVLCPDIRVIAFTGHAEIGPVRSALDAGVSAYLLKQSESKVVLEAIQAVADRRTYLDPQLHQLQKCPRGFISTQLSEREREVVALVAAGHSHNEIATQLNLSAKTVETYRYRAAEKLGLRSRSDLVRYALDRGWLAAPVAAGADEGSC